MKSIFLKNREACDWLAETVHHPHFELARVNTISQVALILSGQPGDEHKLKGAVLALETLATLWDKPILKEKPVDRLNYQA